MSIRLSNQEVPGDSDGFERGVTGSEIKFLWVEE